MHPAQTIIAKPTPSTPPTESLTLDPISGPAVGQIKVEADKAAVLGRSGQCEAVLADESVSRRHASIGYVSGTWLVTDLGSRHGTHVNAARLGENQSAPLRTGDLVGVGPWSFRVRIGGTGASSHAPSTAGQRFVTTMDAPASPGAARERVERVAERELAAITQNRLQLLMEVAAAVAGSGDELSLARTIVRAAAEGTGFPRAFLLRDAKGIAGMSKVDGGSGIGLPGAAEELTLVSDWPEGASGEQQALSFSRSLIGAARKGEVARLTSDAPMTAASIMSLGIQTALCAPISVGSSVGAFLYLDAREGELSQARHAGPPGGGGGVPGAAGQTKSSRAAGGGGVYQDAAAFCLALAKMYGLALSNIARQELEHRQRELVRDLEAAREAQKMIMPPETGALGALKYAMRCKSGRYVAGDLFDVIDLGDGKVAVFLGDVAGKGISAAILMATAQTHLNVSLRAIGDAGRVASAVNRHICKHAHSNKFISLWLGVFDTKARTLQFVDAGHGHWVHVSPGEGGAPKIRRVDSATGIPLGIDPDFEYQSEQLTIGPTDRLVVFSDGVVEQPGGAPGSESDLFGLERTIRALMPSAGVEQDVATLFNAVLAYALTDELADDTTVSSIQVG